MAAPTDLSSRKRLSRALLRLLEHERSNLAPLVRAQLDNIFFVARSMNFAAKLREFGSDLTPALALEFSAHAGIGGLDLRLRVLPVLKAAGVVDFQYDGSDLKRIEEYVGVSAPLLDQVLSVFDQVGPSDVEWAVINSVELASWAPLTMDDHLQQLSKRGFDDETAQLALQYATSAMIVASVGSTALNDKVVYSPYVWGSEAVEVAGFMKGLPSSERDVLLSVCGDATARPGLQLSSVTANPRIVAGARRVGLLQAATVRSSNQLSQTYLFSPLLDREDDAHGTTESLHERKLFIAHILFGHERAIASGGRIKSPTVLVNALLTKGKVGPATNIGSDYHLLEAAGIVRVEDTDRGPLLRLVKEEIVSDSLGTLRRMSGDDNSELDVAALSALRPPREFISPEHDRLSMGADAATSEVMDSAILNLREEAARAARHEEPF